MKKKRKIKRSFIVITAVLLLLLICLPFLINAVMESASGFYKTNVIPVPYADLVNTYSQEYKVPSSVIYAVMKSESNFKPDAVSNAGAVGLMQIMPDTFLWLTKLSKADYAAQEIYEPQANLHLGVFYLSWLYERFNDWELVYAAYNAGHNRVKDWLENPEYSQNGKLTVIPIQETDKYVDKVTHYREQYQNYYPELD